MSLSAEQRGDLAEEMLPTAAHLAVLVHGDGGPEDVGEVLAGLSDVQKNALIVVLAGLVDPEQPVGKALGWLAFNEHGTMVVPASWSEDRPVRDLAPEPVVDMDDYVDHAAVAKFVKGSAVQLSDADFLQAVRECAALGMTLPDIERMHGWAPKTAANWINRLKKRHQRSGRPFPELGLTGQEFTREQVLDIRRRAHRGTSDVVLAVEFDVNRETIRSVVSGRSYASYGGPIRSGRSTDSTRASREYMCGHADNSQAGGYQARNAVLSPRDRETIRAQSADGASVKELASEFGVRTTTIRKYKAA